MPVITIQITYPEGAEVAVSEQLDPSTVERPVVRDAEDVERYFRDYLSENGRKLYAAAARIEKYGDGPGYTLGAIAADLSMEYASAQSYHRTSGRSARKWKDDTGTEAPIVLNDLSYAWVAEENGMRNRYELPPGVAEIVADLAAS